VRRWVLRGRDGATASSSLWCPRAGASADSVAAQGKLGGKCACDAKAQAGSAGERGASSGPYLLLPSNSGRTADADEAA
jgi:hypothetical protein